MVNFIHKIIYDAFDSKVSDLHLTVAMPPTLRINGELVPQGTEKLTPEDIEQFVDTIISDHHKKELQEKGETDFAFSVPQRGRLRVNV